ncbi:MAG: hypothetical protein QOD88_3704 [Mycobacterium sp.]|nr:hypothetical protein [Mycobacterium sp.]
MKLDRPRNVPPQRRQLTLARLCEVWGRDGLLDRGRQGGNAVNYPYESSQEAVAGFESTTLCAAVKAKIAHGNAERILRI